MQYGIKEFIKLVNELLTLERDYQKSQSECKHFEFLLYNYGKDNSNKLSIAKYECEDIFKKIDEKKKEILNFSFDPQMQIYYDSYNEYVRLLERSWQYEIEIGYINSIFIFGCICDDETDTNLSNKRDRLKNEKEAIDKQLEEIDSNMKKISKK
jgi:hypothetical protein